MTTETTERLCVRCGHRSAYHGAGFCSLRVGTAGQRPQCDCAGWSLAATDSQVTDRLDRELELGNAYQRIAELEAALAATVPAAERPLPHQHQSFAARDACEACTTEMARLRALAPEGPETTLRPWLRHHVWCNCKTDDPPNAERCKCGLAAALVPAPTAPAGLREALGTLKAAHRTQPWSKFWEGWDAALVAVDLAVNVVPTLAAIYEPVEGEPT